MAKNPNAQSIAPGKGGGANGAGVTDVVYATNHGLGDGHTADGTALLQGIDAALHVAFHQQPSIDRTANVVTLRLPNGVFEMADAGGGLVRPIFDGNGLTGAGTLRVESAGHTILKASQNVGRGKLTVAAGGVQAGQSVTIPFTAPHGLAVGDLVVIPLVTRAYIVRNHYTVDSLAGPSAIVIKAGLTGDPAFLPPPGTVIDKQDALVKCFNWSTQWRLHFTEGIEIQLNGAGLPLPASPYDPQIGCAFLRTADVDTTGLRYSHAWAGGLVCGTAMGSGAAQNTDHFESRRDKWNNNWINELIVDNQAGGGGVGGSRDWIYDNCNMSAAGLSFWSVSDGGSLANWHPTTFHGKSCSYPIYFEGIDGVNPRITYGIEIHSAEQFKPETPANATWVYDESHLRALTKIKGLFLEERGGITINGGSDANDHTNKPWAFTNVSLVGGVLTGTLPAGHSVQVGDGLAVGGTGNAAIDAVASLVSSVVGNVVTLPVPSYGGADVPGPLTGIAGEVLGWRIGTIQGSSFSFLVDVDNSDRMARTCLQKHVEDIVDCEIEIIQPSDPTGETRGFGGYGFADLPVFTLGSGLPISSCRFTVRRGDQVYLPRIHDTTDANALVAGMQVELSTAGMKRSQAHMMTEHGGVTQQGAPVGGVRAVVHSVGPANATARVWVDRPVVLCAQPPSQLAASMDVQGVLVTGSVGADDLLYDNGDGTAIAWDKVSSGRLIGKSLSADVAGVVIAELHTRYTFGPADPALFGARYNDPTFDSGPALAACLTAAVGKNEVQIPFGKTLYADLSSFGAGGAQCYLIAELWSKQRLRVDGTIKLRDGQPALVGTLFNALFANQNRNADTDDFIHVYGLGVIDGNAVGQVSGIEYHGVRLWRTRDCTVDDGIVINVRGTSSGGSHETFAVDAYRSSRVNYRRLRANSTNAAGDTSTAISANYCTDVVLEAPVARNQKWGQGITFFQTRGIQITDPIVQLNGHHGLNFEHCDDVDVTGGRIGGSALALVGHESAGYTAGQSLGNGTDGNALDGGICVLGQLPTTGKHRFRGTQSNNNTNGLVINGPGAIISGWNAGTKTVTTDGASAACTAEMVGRFIYHLPVTSCVVGGGPTVAAAQITARIDDHNFVLAGVPTNIAVGDSIAFDTFPRIRLVDCDLSQNANYGIRDVTRGIMGQMLVAAALEISPGTLLEGNGTAPFNNLIGVSAGKNVPPLTIGQTAGLKVGFSGGHAGTTLNAAAAPGDGGRLLWTPVPLNIPISLLTLAIDVTTAGTSGFARAGVWLADPVTGLPSGAPVADTGRFALVAATGPLASPSFAGTVKAIPRAPYVWLGVVFDNLVGTWTIAAVNGAQLGGIFGTTQPTTGMNLFPFQAAVPTNTALPAPTPLLANIASSGYDVVAGIG